MWNNSHWKLTGSWQKDSCTIKVARKIHTWWSRKGGIVIRFRPVSLGVFSEEGRKYTDSLGSEHDLSQRLGFLVLGSYLEDTSPLVCWRASRTNRRAGEEEPGYSSWGRHTLNNLRSKTEKSLLSRLLCFYHLLPTCPSPSYVNATVPLTPCHSVALDLGHPWLGKRLIPRTPRWPSPGAEPGQGWWRSLLELTQAMPQKLTSSGYQESMQYPTNFVECFHK